MPAAAHLLVAHQRVAFSCLWCDNTEQTASSVGVSAVAMVTGSKAPAGGEND